ncbi:MAG: polysaccharide biosynthesis transport protein, partial [Bradyrhizobium sp.]|nr:polysaccharide biosynthesis transport protein [Bradyrhizobium sp.]
MIHGSPTAEGVSGPAANPTSWEAPADPRAKSRGEAPTPLIAWFAPGRAVAFLRMNGRRIISIALALFALGIVVLMIVPTRYAATALVVVDPREQRVTTEQDVLPGIGQDAAALQSLIEIAKSDGFLRPLIDQLKVAEDEEISGGETEISRLLEKFRAHLDISRRGLTYVIAMTFLSKSPQRAAYYANAIAEAFVASQRQVRSEATDDAAGWLNSRLKILNDRLRASEDAVAEFKLQHKIVNAGRESTTQQLRVTELSQQVSAARLRTEEAKTRYEQAQRDLKANVDGPVKQDLLSMLRAQR